MPAVFEQLFVLQRTAICDRKAMELEAAREILAEVFGVRLSEVDEMIRSRFQTGENDKLCHEDDGQWPQELWVQG